MENNLGTWPSLKVHCRTLIITLPSIASVSKPGSHRRHALIFLGEEHPGRRLWNIHVSGKISSHTALDTCFWKSRVGSCGGDSWPGQLLYGLAWRTPSHQMQLLTGALLGMAESNYVVFSRSKPTASLRANLAKGQLACAIPKPGRMGSES